MDNKDYYYLISKENIESLPIKESLGHKLIGVEPDLIIDFHLNTPRIFIKNYYIDDIGLSNSPDTESVYYNSKSRKLYADFTLLHPHNEKRLCRYNAYNRVKKTDIYDIIPQDKCALTPIIKIDKKSILVDGCLVEKIKSSSIRDIEYRV